MKTLLTTSVSGLALAGSLLAVAPSASASASAVPECTNANLSATYQEGGAATSHLYGRIVLRNTSQTTCSVRGYGGLSYVGGGDGHQVGAAADRTGPAARRVVVAPGEKVRSRVVETSTGPYSEAQCSRQEVDGFRVYLPDETRSQFIAHPTTGCAKTSVHLLTHTAYR